MSRRALSVIAADLPAFMSVCFHVASCFLSLFPQFEKKIKQHKTQKTVNRFQSNWKVCILGILETAAMRFIITQNVHIWLLKWKHSNKIKQKVKSKENNRIRSKHIIMYNFVRCRKKKEKKTERGKQLTSVCSLVVYSVCIYSMKK